MLRDIAQGIADYITKDEVLRERGLVSVVVEDKADYGFEIATAISQLGVCVTVAITGFRVVANSPVLEGTLQVQISCYEHPALNRADLSCQTAQFVNERLARILHYHRFPFLRGQFILKDFSRDDVDDANITRGNYEVHTRLGFEDAFFAAQ